jgi:hypothetical protein
LEMPCKLSPETLEQLRSELEVRLQ